MSSAQLEKFIVYFTWVYTAIFSLNALVRGNVEFIYYTAVMVTSISLILFINRRMHFYPVVLMSLSLLGLLHLLGGNIMLGDTRLYDFFFIPDVFRYDNLMHMLGSAIMVLLAHALLSPVLPDEFENRNRGGYYVVLLVLVGMGLGAINEIIEFFAVLVFDVGKQVGDYTNTLLDLVFNTIGSLMMAAYIVYAKPILTRIK